MQTTSTITGNCSQMCPAAEMAFREQQKLLHPMEILSGTEKHKQPKANKSKIIKRFCRSSAGQQMQNANDLRPYAVLLDTVIYLLNQAICNENYPWHVRYDFITDRLRAIRQDMIIQNMPNVEVICLLQPITRFYAYASYKMCMIQHPHYDPHLNDRQFEECLNRLIGMYNECDEMSTRLQQMINPTAMFEDCRPQIEAIYILFHLGNDYVLQRAVTLAPRWKNTPELRAAIKIGLAYRNRNVIATCRGIAHLPLVLALIAAVRLPLVRRACLEIMTCAYNSNRLQFPLAHLQRLLLYTRISDLLNDLKVCGIAHDAGGVTFVKGQLQSSVKLSVCEEKFVNDKLQGISLGELLLTGSCEQ